jgi:site-specific recombinase XerC
LEVVALDLADVDRETGALRVRGKGRKERRAYLAGGSLEALGAWLEVRETEPGPLFWQSTPGREVVPARLSAQGVARICARRAKDSGIAPFAPDDGRRTFVGELLDAGANLATVQQLAGHANVATTARYDRRPEAAKRRAASLLAVPYTPV